VFAGKGKNRWRTQIGESFVGEGGEAAHLNTVLGRRGGPVEMAWTTALATPRAGHVPFVVVLRPNLPVQPPTLFVNKAPLAGERHETLTWGAAQAGVAGGVADAVAAGIVRAEDVDALLLVAAVWVSPAASDEGAVYANNRTATLEALRAGSAGSPAAADVLAARAHPLNPYFAGPRVG
jgi:5,6,7,8-tetrahydromethanopterin hydro-lyase